jgi:hypothetical protein
MSVSEEAVAYQLASSARLARVIRAEIIGSRQTARRAYAVRVAPLHGKAHRSIVYFIQATRGGPVKIGTSDDVSKRLSQLQSGSPYPLRVVAALDGGSALERELHSLFAAHRLSGEWFHPHREIEQYLRERRALDRLLPEPYRGDGGVMLPPFDVSPLPPAHEYRRVVGLLARGGWWAARDVGKALGNRQHDNAKSRTTWASAKCTHLWRLGWVAKRQRYFHGDDGSWPGHLRNEYALRRLIEEGVVT